MCDEFVIPWYLTTIEKPLEAGALPSFLSMRDAQLSNLNDFLINQVGLDERKCSKGRFPIILILILIVALLCMILLAPLNTVQSSIMHLLIISYKHDVSKHSKYSQTLSR